MLKAKNNPSIARYSWADVAQDTLRLYQRSLGQEQLASFTSSL